MLLLLTTFYYGFLTVLLLATTCSLLFICVFTFVYKNLPQSSKKVANKVVESRDILENSNTKGVGGEWGGPVGGAGTVSCTVCVEAGHSGGPPDSRSSRLGSLLPHTT